MTGFSTWALRDVIVIILIVFNGGLTMGIYMNHVRHLRSDIRKLQKDVDQLYGIVNKNGEKLAKVEGRLNHRGGK